MPELKNLAVIDNDILRDAIKKFEKPPEQMMMCFDEAGLMLSGEVKSIKKEEISEPPYEVKTPETKHVENLIPKGDLHWVQKDRTCCEIAGIILKRLLLRKRDVTDFTSIDLDEEKKSLILSQKEDSIRREISLLCQNMIPKIERWEPGLERKEPWEKVLEQV